MDLDVHSIMHQVLYEGMQSLVASICNIYFSIYELTSCISSKCNFSSSNAVERFIILDVHYES
jgi:hypothetical protein